MPHLWPTGSSSGWPPSITARYFSSCPSDSTSRWTPCPPEHCRLVASGPPWLVSGFRFRARLGFSIPSRPPPAREALPPLLDTALLIRAPEGLQPSTDARLPSLHAVLTTPVDWIGACWLGWQRSPAPGSSPSNRPSPLICRVGVHIVTFEACSSFTRVTACKVARPPKVDFVARLQPDPLPDLTARQLSNLTNNCSSGSSPHW